MISNCTEKLCAELLYQVAKGELIIEMLRKSLCQLCMFHPHTAFNRFDREGKGLITPKDLQQFLSDNQIQTTDVDCYFIMTYFDTNLDGCLDYDDFKSILLTSDSAIKEQVLKQPHFAVGKSEMLPYDIEHGIACILNKEYELHKLIESIRNQINLRYDFSVVMFFKNNRDDGAKFLTVSNIKHLLKMQKMKYTDDIISGLFKRIDKDKDNMLSINDLERTFLPVEPYTSHNPGYFFPTNAFLAQTSVGKRKQRKM